MKQFLNFREFEKISLSVPKPWLLLAAGLTWTLVGAMLCRLAGGWLSTASSFWSILSTVVGFLASLVIYRLGFVKIAHQNRSRINNLSARACFFAFYPVKSYLLVILMMSVGMFLRSTSIPKEYLAILYLAVGGALFLSSLHYYRPAYQAIRGQSD